MANTVWRDTPSISARSSFESISSSSSSGDSDYNLLGNQQDIALQPLGEQTQASDEQYGTAQTAISFQDGASVEVEAQKPTAEAGEALGTSDSTDTTKPEEKPKTDSNEIYNTSVDGLYHVPAPERYRGGVLGQMLKLYKQPDFQSIREGLASSSKHASPKHRRSPSDVETVSTTPERRKWYDQNASQDTLATLIGASTNLAKPAQPQDGIKKPRHHKRDHSLASRFSQFFNQEEAHVKQHIAGIVARREFILKCCRALMLYGAPTHRLEEYLTMTARALQIEAQFLYIPGCMIISFDDAETHTTEVKLVRLTQGIDLGRLKDVHRIYKEVIHDVIGVEDATAQLEDLMVKKAKFHPWLRVLVFGLTSVTAAPFSFDARLIDLPLSFCFGCVVGALQLIVAPMSPLYSNVFEVSATVLISFLARAFGSIRGGDLFCFSALAQAGIVMLLPGYMFLSSSLELQAKSIVAGSIRIVYGVIYSLLLGFGITLGAALYGMIDNNATSELTCKAPMPGTYGFIFVPFFVLCISMLYQAKWRQMPVMVLVAFAGYVVNSYSSKRFNSSPQIASTLGAFAVGALANLYSRFRHGVAAAILIPAIFTQVPGGLASTGGLLSGLQVANEINNVTSAVNTTTADPMGLGTGSSYIVFGVASSMIQIAIGITVGLFLSALVVYPLGKRRSGLFSF